MTKGKLSMIAAALLLAGGLVGAKVLLAPSVSQAAASAGIDTEQMTLATPTNLPSFDDRYQAHTGVLDRLLSP